VDVEVDEGSLGHSVGQPTAARGWQDLPGLWPHGTSPLKTIGDTLTLIGADGCRQPRPFWTVVLRFAEPQDLCGSKRAETPPLGTGVETSRVFCAGGCHPAVPCRHGYTGHVRGQTPDMADVDAARTKILASGRP
jgi:hypothetical protein